MIDPQSIQLGPTWSTLLGYSVIGAMVTTLGTLFGLVIKEFFLTRSFEKGRLRQTLAAVERKYHDPMTLSALDLLIRLNEIVREYPTDFLSSDFLDGSYEVVESSAVRNRRFQCYKLQSTVYRLCAFLGWLELYRQDVVFLSGRKRPYDELFHQLRSDLADGQLNTAHDWHLWTDALIFREEQRAIGEMMITSSGAGRVVIGYGQFSRMYMDSSCEAASWIDAVKRFFVDPAPPKDFRLIRIQRFIVHLVDLMEILDSRCIRPEYYDARKQYKAKLM